MKRLLSHILPFVFTIFIFAQCGNSNSENKLRFEDALDKGNGAWAKNNYKQARTHYAEAFKLRPKDAYVAQRLKNIDSILANQTPIKNIKKRKKHPPKQYAFEDAFVGGFARVKNGKKWGYIDREKQEIVAPTYDEAAHFNHGFARIRVKDKYGFIDTTGKEIIKPKDYEKAGKFGEEKLVFVMKEKKYGYVDTTGKEVVEFKYDWAGNFFEKRAKVSIGSKFGFIDAKGEEVIALEYDGVRNFKNEVAAVWKNRKWGFINVEGKEVIPFKYDRVEDFRNAKYKDKYGNKKEKILALVVLGGKTFYIDKKGKCVVNCDE